LTELPSVLVAAVAKSFVCNDLQHLAPHGDRAFGKITVKYPLRRRCEAKTVRMDMTDSAPVTIVACPGRRDYAEVLAVKRLMK
jgi:hypothetical protein